MDRIIDFPQTLLHKLEQHYGYDLSQIQLIESSDIPNSNVLAYASGHVVKFAPGNYNPDTYFGRYLLAHEVAHVIQQAWGMVLPQETGLCTDSRLEYMADCMALYSLIRPTPQTPTLKPLLPLPAIRQELYPIQAWSINPLGSMAVTAGVSSLAEGEHESLTRLAAEEANHRLDQDKLIPYSVEQLNNLHLGSRFNDLCGFNIASFAVLYKNRQNPFINQSHSGEMQFLHSMNNGEPFALQIEKQLRWVAFTLDVFQNKGEMLNKSLYMYLTESNDDMLNQMLFPIMLQPSVMDEINRVGKTRAERYELIKAAIKTDEKCFQYYKNVQIRNFLNLENRTANPQMIALGSLVHMVEDSFTKAHTQRCVSFESNTKDMQPVLLFSNYEKQDPDWHHRADLFLKSKDLHDEDFDTNRPAYDKALKAVIEKTEGACEAVHTVSNILYSLKKYPNQAQEKIIDIVKDKLKVYGSMMTIQAIHNAKAEGNVQEAKRIVESIKDTDLGRLDFKKSVLPTAGGRQFHSASFTVDKNDRYNKMLTEERDNTLYSVDKKLGQYKMQLDLLEEIASTSGTTPIELEKIRSSVVEIFLHLIHIKENKKTNVETLLSHAVKLINC